MKIILMILVFCVCVALGFVFSLKYKRRSNFFKAMITLAQKLDIGINFSRERLHSIISGLDDGVKKNLLGIDKNYLEYLDGTQSELDGLFKSINILKEQEKEVVLMFFKMLGRSDVDSQSREIKNFLSRFEDLSNAANEENKKYGGLSLKMGVIVGLIAVIILW